MSENNDYEDILSGSVDEVKEEVKDMDKPDFRELLRLEKEGKDRKTLKDYFERNMEVEVEEMDEEEVSQGSEEMPEGTLDSMSFGHVLVLGAAIGLIAGMAAGYYLAPGAASDGSPQQAKVAVEELITAGGFNGTVDVGSPERRHGMYFFNVTFTQETPNGTETGNQAAYVTRDAELFFPVVDSFFLQSPINIKERLAQQQAQSQEPQPQQPPQ